MHYVYVLKSDKDAKMYTGCTNNLKARVAKHNTGQVASTKNRRPLKIIFYEAFMDKSDAFKREQWLKTGWGRNHLTKILSNYLKNLGG
jgi:putative endonuclease